MESVVLIYLLFYHLVCGLNENKTSEALYEEDSLSDNPKIFYLHSLTNITNRYATTLVTCKIKNPSVVSKEATFSLVISDRAFISDFVMEINNKSYQAYVKEKEEAQKIYDTAVQKGQGAAQVKVSTRNSKRFIVSVNLEPEEKASFYLKYEELLEKNQDQYEVVMNLHPGQLVKNLKIEVIIEENQGFKYINAGKLRRGNTHSTITIDANSRIIDIGDTKRLVIFSPNEDEQQNIAAEMEVKKKWGIVGQFYFTYAVGQKYDGGLILQNRDYFVHFYTPSDVTEKIVPPKYIIFILDTSESMYGLKLDHMKRAMNNILSRLRREDLFNIVEFNSFTKVWDVSSGLASYKEGKDDFLEDYLEEENIEVSQILPPPHVVNYTTIKKAKSIIDLFEPIGGTDLNTAFKVGFKLLNQYISSGIIMLLSDGEATNGELNYDKILQTVRNLNKNEASIYTLSIGCKANIDFLKKISFENHGKFDCIYESDEGLNFFNQVHAPVIKNVTFDYGSNVSEVTNHCFNNLFLDSEIVIAGKKWHDLNFSKLTTSINHGQIKENLTVETVERADLKRLWAYLRVKQLLNQRKIAEDKTILNKKALNLALKYSFVTELTSLVVVKPTEIEVIELEDGIIGTPAPFCCILPPHATLPSPAAAIPPTFNSSHFKPTTFKPPVYTLPDWYVNDTLQILRNNLPWVDPLLKFNSTLHTKIFIESLQLNFVPWLFEPPYPICNVTIDGSLKYGQCKGIRKCGLLYPKLTSLNEYFKYTCHKDSYAGICC